MRQQTLHPIKNPGDVAEARRRAVAMAANHGFNETDVGRVALVTTEMATNIGKHAKRGEIIIGYSVDSDGVEVTAVDAGPGIPDVHLSMRNGYSTAGSAGTGLGAIARVATFVDIHSAPGAGTVVLARVVAKGRSPGARRFLEVRGVCLPMGSETLSGDAWDFQEAEGRSLIMVADGLGHGPFAFQAAQEAVRIFQENLTASLEEILVRSHAVLRSTRGAAVALAEVVRGQRNLRFASMGNVSARIVTRQGARNLVSQNGTVGLEMPRVQVTQYPWPDDASLIMHSDGLATHWDLQKYPGLLARDPGVLAAVLYRDHSRRRDDVTVVVARNREAPP